MAGGGNAPDEPRHLVLKLLGLAPSKSGETYLQMAKRQPAFVKRLLANVFRWMRLSRTKQGPPDFRRDGRLTG